MKLYTLDYSDNLIHEEDPMRWGEWMSSKGNVLVVEDSVKRNGESYDLVTEFTGFDILFGSNPHGPVLWRTTLKKVSGPTMSLTLGSYDSKERAVEGHDNAYKQLFEENKVDMLVSELMRNKGNK